MKKRNWLMTIAFAVLSLTIVSTMVIGTTYAKFVSKINNAGSVNAAGFLITGETAGQLSNVMIAPGDTENITVTIKYFSQVDTEITPAAAESTSGNTGAFSTSNWSAILTFFNATGTHAALNTYYGITENKTSAATATTPGALIAVNSTTMLTQFATNAGTAGLTTQTVDSHLYIQAMANDAQAPKTVTVTVPVTWTTDSTGGDAFDTLVGNCIAALLNPVASTYANVSVSGTTVTLHFDFDGDGQVDTGETLALTANGSGTASSTESRIAVNAGFTATQYTGETALTWS